MDSKRYDRQIRVAQIGPTGQERLASSTVWIIGLGATGTYTAEQLTRTGVGHLLLVDDDLIELSNLQRQSLYSEADLGQPKVLAAKEKLRAINSEIRLESFQETFDKFLFEEMAVTTKPDLVLDCTDNFLVRELINDYCRKERLTFVFCAAAGTTGQVMALNPTIGPCLSCVFPNLTALEQSCETIGVVTPLIPLVSSLQVGLALRILTEPGFADWSSLRVVDVWGLEMSKFSIPKHCALCQNQPPEKVELESVCGGAFQAFFPDFDPEKFANYCEQKTWPLKQNPIALATADITAFRSGRILFYRADAKEIFKELKEILL